MKIIPKSEKVRLVVGTAAVTVVAVLGGVLAKDQIQGGAAVTAKTASEEYGVLQAKAKAHPEKAQVPYVGPFTFKGCGPAITEMEKALIRKHFRKKPAAPCIGVATRNQIKAFQRFIHYKPTGTYTLATHRQLVARGGYTLISRGKLITYAKIRYVQAYRNAVRRIAAHAALVGGNTLVYSQSGGRQSFPAWPRLPPYTDCSGLVIWIEYQAGAGPAVGYFGPGSVVGYTGTLGNQGRHVPFGARLYPGDVVLYGGGNHYHAAIYIGNGLVLSHGGTGVKLLPWNYNGDVGDIRRMVSSEAEKF